jgi:hypothetical protein
VTLYHLPATTSTCCYCSVTYLCQYYINKGPKVSNYLTYYILLIPIQKPSQINHQGYGSSITGARICHKDPKKSTEILTLRVQPFTSAGLSSVLSSLHLVLLCKRPCMSLFRTIPLPSLSLTLLRLVVLSGTKLWRWQADLLPLPLQQPFALPYLFSFPLAFAILLHRLPLLTPTPNPCLSALGCWSVIPMPKVVETLLQVKQRQTRELKARTEARCAELLRGSDQESSLHHNRSEPVSICLCCICRTAQARTQARCAELLLGHHQESSLHHNTPEPDIHQALKEWSLCINVCCFLLILCAVNCLFLQYILLFKSTKL